MLKKTILNTFFVVNSNRVMLDAIMYVDSLSRYLLKKIDYAKKNIWQCTIWSGLISQKLDLLDDNTSQRLCYFCHK